MTWPKFEFELNYSNPSYQSLLCTPALKSLWKWGQESHIALHRLILSYVGSTHHISFFFHRLFPSKQGSILPMLHMETQTHSTFLFSLFHAFVHYLSQVYHYGSYTLAVEKHTVRINIFFRYIFIICCSSNYLF